jgi:hypothetical protein
MGNEYCYSSSENYAEEQLAVELGEDPARWLTYWQRVFPFKYEEDFEHWLEGLRKAGVPA